LRFYQLIFEKYQKLNPTPSASRFRILEKKKKNQKDQRKKKKKNIWTTISSLLKKISRARL